MSQLLLLNNPTGRILCWRHHAPADYRAKVAGRWGRYYCAGCVARLVKRREARKQKGAPV